MRIGVLTGGGDCPGLNAVIRAVTRKGVEAHGWEIVGFRNGWQGPVEGSSRPIGLNDVEDILTRGGTILGSAPMLLDNPDSPLNKQLDQICKQAADQIRKQLGRVKISELASK